MRKCVYVVFVLFLISVFLRSSSYHTPRVQASSQQAYQDYLYQFDTYRQKYSEFTVAKNEYLKFKTLTSQTTALDKTKSMLSQRDLLLRSYLLLLNEKLNEDQGLGSTEKVTYQRLIQNEVKFLEDHSRLVSNIGSLEDSSMVSRELESHYAILGASMRQTITGVSLGKLAVISKRYDQALADATSLIAMYHGIFTPQKQSTINRWLLQITNTKSLYQQKIDTIVSKNTQLVGTSTDGQGQTFSQITKDVAEARQYLVEGSGYMRELMEALRYQD